MDACETNNTDLFNKVHMFEPMKVHTFEPNIRLIRLFSLMLNDAKPRILIYFKPLSIMYLLLTIASFDLKLKEVVVSGHIDLRINVTRKLAIEGSFSETGSCYLHSRMSNSIFSKFQLHSLRKCKYFFKFAKLN